MKVLITTPDLNKGGGVATYFRTLWPCLNEFCEYLTLGAGRRKGIIASSGRLILCYFRLILKMVAGYDPVHLNPSLLPRALVRDGISLLIARFFGKNVIIFFHGWNLEFEKRLRERWLWLFRNVYFRADVLIVLSNKFREKLLEFGCKKPIFCETTAIPESIFKETEKDIGKKWERRSGFDILFLSRVEKEKGIYETLEAFAILTGKYPWITLTVAGYGSELESANKYAKNRKISDVKFAGYLDGKEKTQAFLSANCYLLPSYSEGMPISVLEAMAYGLPIITRSVGGIPDFFENGRMGFMTESLDPAIFADLIERLILDPKLCKEISAYNREYAFKNFRASEVAKRLVNIYRSLA